MTTNAVLAYNNFYKTGTVSASSDPAATPKENAIDDLLYDYWQPTSGTSHQLDLDLGGATSVDVFGFYSSDFYSLTGAACKLYQSDDDSTYTLVSTITPATIGAKLKLVTASSHRYWRIQFDTTGAETPKIQHAFIGKSLEMQRGLGAGFAPMALGSENVPINSETDTGIFIGRSNKKRAIPATLNFSNLTPAWMRTHWPTILSALESSPFMVLPSPDTYPNEAAFCWTSGIIQTPPYSKDNLLGVSIPIKARIT